MTAPVGTVPPVDTAGGRQALPDQLRGLALLGIVLVNAPYLLVSTAGATPASVAGLADRVAGFLVVVLAQGKFYLLFSFLFGVSLTLMLRRRSEDGVRRYRRRLAGLAVLGLLHAVGFFVGDILLSYAVLGLALLWFLPRSDRTAIAGAGVAYAVALALLTLLVVDPGTAAQDELLRFAERTDAGLLGSFVDGAVARFEALPGALVFLGTLNWPLALAMFLVGLVAGRRGLLARPEEHGRLWRRLLVLAAVVGLPGSLLSGWLSYGPGAELGSTRDLVGTAVGFATAPALTAGYVAVVALATRSRLLRRVEPAGRMSLTAYLGESVLLAAVACGWGLGLLGEVGLLTATLVAAAAWAVLEVLAHGWLRRFAYGPFEWLLRCWTYGRRMPLRLTPGAATAAGAPSEPPRRPAPGPR